MTDTLHSTAAAPVDESVVEVHGWPTTVRRAGSGRTVLSLHGAFFPTRWLPFHDRLAARADVVAPVLPGYLEGGPPDWLLGFDDLVLHVRALLDALRVDRVDLLGFDLGGWLAGTFAVFFPDRVRSLTVIAPTGLRVPEAPPMEWMAADPARVVDALFNGDPGPHAGMFPPPSDIDGFVQAYGENGVTARLVWERRYDVRLERRLGHLALPAHVVTPADDRLVPVQHARRWAAAIPGSRLTTLDGVGHALVLQDPDRVASVVSSFIEEVPA
jgi:pimeloyl-ACP methyl ester carboxylesterase